jgi:hypothetical protein
MCRCHQHTNLAFLAFQLFLRSLNVVSQRSCGVTVRPIHEFSKPGTLDMPGHSGFSCRPAGVRTPGKGNGPPAGRVGRS